MPVIRVSTKGQVVIPAALRRQLGIAPGTYVEASIEGSDLRLHPLEGTPSQALRGCLAHLKTGTDDLLRLRQQERQREKQRIQRPENSSS